MPTGVCHPLFISSYYFGRVMKWKWCEQISNPSIWKLQATWKLGIMIKNLVRSSLLPYTILGVYAIWDSIISRIYYLTMYKC